jgi:dTDP-4-dehydrorhamnose reductase
VRKILIVGSDGLIGRSILRCGYDNTLDFFATTRKRRSSNSAVEIFDLRDADALKGFVERRFTTVVICAGITSIDACERDPVGTAAVNVDSTINVARAFLDAGAHVIYFSTNTIFDGTEPDVNARAQPCPLTEYGRQKAKVEFKLSSLWGKLTIVRLAKVIGRSSPLFAGWVRSLKNNETIYPYREKKMAPVSVNFLCRVLIEIIKKEYSGLIQLSANRDISYSDAAFYLADRLGVSRALVRPRLLSIAQPGLCPAHTTLEPYGLADLGFSVPAPWAALDIFIDERLNLSGNAIMGGISS